MNIMDFTNCVEGSKSKSKRCDTVSQRGNLHNILSSQFENM